MSEFIPVDASALDQYYADYVRARTDRIAEANDEKAWQMAHRAQTYMHASATPQRVTDFMRADPNKSPLPFGPVTVERQTELSAERTAFVDSIEEAWTSNQGEIPLSWFMQFDVEDLNAMRADELGVNVDMIARRQMLMANHEEFIRRVEEETDRRFEGHQRGRKFGRDMTVGTVRALDFLNPFGDAAFLPGIGGDAEEVKFDYLVAAQDDRAEIRNEVWLEFTGQRDKIFDEDIAEWRFDREKELRETPKTAQDRSDEFNEIKERLFPGTEGLPLSPEQSQQVRALLSENNQFDEAALDEEEANFRALIVAGGDPGDLLDQRTAFHNVVAGGLGGLGWGIDKLATGAGGLLWAADGILPGEGAYDWAVNRHKDQQAEGIAAYENLLATPEDEAIARAAMVGAEQAWAEMDEINPEAKQFYLDMADGVESMAFGFFAGDMTEAPDVAAQLSQMSRELREQDEMMIEELREQDFRFSHQVMDVLSMWGRNGPGRIATSFTLLLTDQDYWDEISAGKWGDLWNQLGEDSERMGFTPAAAVGLDGSLAGLGMDMGLGIAFDPTTYFLGPKFLGAAKGAMMGTVDDAARIARSAPVRAMTDDIINWAQSPSRGASSTYHMMSWLDDTAIGKILDVTGFQTQVLKARNWVNDATGRGAMEVKLDFLRKLIPDDVDVGDLASLGDDIAENGFKEAGTITISRADQTIHFTDGVKRALAAEAKGISHMPVRLRLSDSAGFAKTVIAGLDDAESAIVRQIADGNVAGRAPEGALAGTVKGADESALQSVLGAINNLGDRVAWTELRNFGEYSVEKAATGGSVIYRVMQDGVAKGGVMARGGKVTSLEGGITMGLEKSLRRKGIMDEVWDLARKEGDEFILQSGRSGSISDNAVSFGQKYARRLLGDAADTLPSAGKAIDDVIDGGMGALKKGLKKWDDKAGDLITRPDRVIPGEQLLGKVDKVKLQKIVEDAIMRGARPQDGARTAAHSSLYGQVRAALKSAVPENVRSFFTQANTVTRMDYHGPGAVQRIMDQTVKMWGDDIAKADHWMQRIMEHQRAAARIVGDNEAKLAVMRAMEHEIQALLDNTGGVWDDPLRGLPSLGKGAEPSARAARLSAQKALTNKMKAYERKAQKVNAKLETMPNQRALHKIVQEMWEDFNRTKIVPKWTKEIEAAAAKGIKMLDDDTGILNWEHLRKGRIQEDLGEFGFEKRKWLPETLEEQAKAAGIENPQKLARMLNNIIDTPMAGNTPLSTVEMIAAATLSGKKWTQFTQTMTGHMVREATNKLHKAWIIDKVLRPATAMTVSGDELLRIFHKSGRWAVKRYLDDRALFLQGRINTALHGGNPLARDAVRKGAAKGGRLSTRVQERLRQLDEWSLRTKELERIFYDDAGIGWSDIKPGDPIYRDTAKQWTGGMMQQSGFRAFLRGEDAFREWFMSVDGESLRNATIMKKGKNGPQTGVAASSDMAYQGWKTMFEKVILSTAKKNGTFDDVLRAFRETAAEIDARGGKALDLPEFVYDNLGPVRGVQKHSRAKFSPLQFTDEFFDRAFLDPVQYRRGFVGDMVAQVEKARIEGLITSQGKRIMSDMEVANALGVKGLAGATRTGVNGFITEQALARGMVPQSYIDDLVQKAADAEMDHMLYVAERGSRFGGVAQKTIFPFGKPHADMMAFWGREMFRRPHFRGKINEESWGMLGDIFTARGHFNPRTAALVSRLASTDFTIDKGWAAQMEEGETKGLLPGSEKTDLDPLLFLPTGGENPFYSMIPGAGYIPMWGLDMLLAKVGDPDNDPLGYQQLVDNIGDVIAGAHFGNPDPRLSIIQRFLGGGTFGQTAEAILDATAIFGDSGAGYGPVSTLLGQPDREIDRGRMASALLADPEEWEELFALTDANTIDLYVDALAAEADNKAAKGNLMENLSRFFAPTNNKFSGELDEIKDVWIDAGAEYGLGSPNFDFDAATPEERTQEADSIRHNFFNLAQWERDMLISQTPQLAVNLISSWTWTDNAEQAGIDGTELSYRTDGSRESLAKHDLYIKQNFIRPLSPQERIRRTIGLVLSAKESTAKKVYITAAKIVNEQLWDNVIPLGDKSALDSIVEGEKEFWNGLGVTNGRELWAAWGSYEDDFERFLGRRFEMDTTKGTDAFDQLRSDIILPTGKIKPWSETWPGIDPLSLSQRMAGVIFTKDDFSPQLRRLAESQGIVLTDGMTGEQIYTAAQAKVTQTDTPLKAYADPSYQTYVGERSAAARVIDEQMRSISMDQRYAPEWRREVENFIHLADETNDRYRESKLGVPAEDQLVVQNAYMAIKQGADDNVVNDFQQLWDIRYKRSFGELGWTPPEPLSPFDDEGNVINGAYQPIIRHVTDGDSLVVKDRVGGQTYHEVRLLGVRARDYGLDDEGAADDKDRLWDRLQQALDDGDSIYLVRQADQFGNVDIYGRELAWLWIGDEPFYFANEMLPNRDPSGGGS